MGLCKEQRFRTISGACSKPQIFGGVPISVPHQSLPSRNILAGPTDSRSRYNGKPAGSTPAQLTIFYGGKVNVFNEITPKKQGCSSGIVVGYFY